MRNFRTKIKMCGFTREQDIETAVQLGVDALGFVFYPPSARWVMPQRAAMLAKNIPPFTERVALFVNPSVQAVQLVIDLLHPSLLQFHGDESPDFCSQFGLPYMKVIRVGASHLSNKQQIIQYAQQFTQAKALLFDTDSAGFGGSGSTFNWSILENVTDRPVVLSGGLHAGNVVQAIQQVRPFAVDVSSGIELAKGIKSPEKMREFTQLVHQQISFSRLSV